jgi:hypothetical protein
MRNNGWHFFLAFTAIALVLYFLSDRSETYYESVEEFASKLKMRENNFAEFSKQMEKDSLLQLTFYAEYRFKAAKYFYQELKGDSLEYGLPSAFAEKETDLSNALKALNVNHIWKYEYENFYRIILRDYHEYQNYNVTFLQLAEGNNDFQFSSGSGLSMSDTTYTADRLLKDKSILVINKRLLARFARKK